MKGVLRADLPAAQRLEALAEGGDRHPKPTERQARVQSHTAMNFGLLPSSRQRL